MNKLLAKKFVIPSGILGLHATLVIVTIWQNSLVVDEPYHIASGLSHFTERNFLADQVNPPLARMIAVLPLLFDPPPFDRAGISDEPGARSEWRIGASWVASNGGAVVGQTRLARLAGVGWSMLGGWILYRFVGRHRGRGAATLALALWCFDPTIISLAAVVTADLPAAVAAVAAASAYDLLLRNERLRVDWPRRLVAGAWLGVALLVKFTLLLLPAFWLAWAIGRGRGTLARRCSAWVAVASVALLVVNAGYGFRGSFRPLGSFRFVSATFAGPSVEDGDRPIPGLWGNRFQGTLLGRVPVPLPEDFVLGIDVQRRDFEHPYPSYVNGHWSGHGWWWFYIYAVELKEPLPWLAVLALACLRALAKLGRRRGDRGSGWPESLGLALFAFVSSQVGFSHHLRYVIPAYPFIIILMSRSVFVKFGKIVPAYLLAAWLGLVAVASTPNGLSYFNPACGGPASGHRYLLFSNVDWGQGVIQLKRWIDDHPGATPIYASCSCPAPPRAYGIDAPPVPRQAGGRKSPGRPSPGYYAISASLLHDPYSDDFAYLDGQAPIATLGGAVLIYHFE